MNTRTCVLVRKGQVDETLRAVPTQGKHSLEPFAAFAKAHGLPFTILEDTDVTDNDAEVHTEEADLWLCLEGNPTFIYGGTLVNPWEKKLPDGTTDPRQLKAKEIRGGEEAVLHPGDWLFIPAGTPHTHRSKGTARLVIIKLAAPMLAPIPRS